MKKLSMTELGRLDPATFRGTVKFPVAFVLDDVRSAYNVGSIFRTADAFRIEVIHLCGITARPPHKDIFKTALGATETVAWEYFPGVGTSLFRLKSAGYSLYAVEQARPSIFLQDFTPAAGQRIAVIFGNEVDGVSNEALNLVDACIEIPQFGTKHSLNVAVTAGIVAWEIIRKMT